MTKLDSYFKTFVKPFEEANTPECQRIVMDSLDIEAGTVGYWVSYTGNTSPDEELRSCFSPIQVVDARDLH